MANNPEIDKQAKKQAEGLESSTDEFPQELIDFVKKVKKK